ncbi:phosphate ABC transporter permease PstA [Olegusella massiliensis]|uniref:phosphate ABC transporter permease PstA n=1 Tax=Olegusella massiliensis TaxID=1776381 RepID=UPI0003ADAEFD|nr:phosphate ABC transporter permease PstA [Olegusella massiliensis]ERL11374.1 phosphate ABC transporter, permease protein PstA [Coriobacteriaceae bacterium BV3Ac1]
MDNSSLPNPEKQINMPSATSSTHVRRVVRQDRLATVILTAIVAFVLALLAGIVIYIVVQGIPVVLRPGFLTNSPLDRVNPGISFELFDSFYMLLWTLIISLPISLGAAIFLVEYAPNNRLTFVVKTAIEALSSFPSIVVGMFGSIFFVAYCGWGVSILSGALALTMFNIPILVRVIQQALEAVPTVQRDASLAMGLTRWETTCHVLLPTAMPAIVTGVVISAGRVFGEAAALIFTSGAAPAMLNFRSVNLASLRNPWNVFRQAETLAVHIYKLRMEPTPGNDQIAWGTAAVLLICILFFNIAARLIGRLLVRKTTGE